MDKENSYLLKSFIFCVSLRRSSSVNRLYDLSISEIKIGDGKTKGISPDSFIFFFFEQFVHFFQFLILMSLLFVQCISIGWFVRLLKLWYWCANASLSATADVVSLNKYRSKSTIALTPGYLSSIVESPTCANWKMIDLWI